MLISFISEVKQAFLCSELKNKTNSSSSLPFTHFHSSSINQYCLTDTKLNHSQGLRLGVGSEDEVSASTLKSVLSKYNIREPMILSLCKSETMETRRSMHKQSDSSQL